MKTNITELVFILDKSGSMSGLESDTIGGFNAMVSKQQKEKYGWEVIFLGANIDAIDTAAKVGISADRAANYHADGEGTRLNYEAVSQVVSEIRANRPIADSWKAEIDADYKRRNKNR